MSDLGEQFELAEMLAILAALGIGGYFAYKFLKDATCIAKPGAIPGITGASQSQVDAAKTAACRLKPGGAIVMQCGSDYDYLQPCGNTVTEARHNALNYVWPWSQPVTYKCVPAACYCFSSDTAQRGLRAVTGD